MIANDDTVPKTRSPRLSRRTLLGVLTLAPALPWLAKAAQASDDDDSGVSKVSWASSSTLLPRQQHTATPLGGGYFLVAGGLSQLALADVEILGPDGFRRAAAPLNIPRYAHAAVRLGDGQVVVLGGCGPDPLDAVEMYDSDRDTWTVLAPLRTPRCLHAACVSGGKILLTGGFFQGILADTELYVL